MEPDATPPPPTQDMGGTSVPPPAVGRRLPKNALPPDADPGSVHSCRSTRTASRQHSHLSMGPCRPDPEEDISGLPLRHGVRLATSHPPFIDGGHPGYLSSSSLGSSSVPFFGVLMGGLHSPPFLLLIIVVGLPSPPLLLGLRGPRQDCFIGHLFWGALDVGQTLTRGSPSSKN